MYTGFSWYRDHCCSFRQQPVKGSADGGFGICICFLRTGSHVWLCPDSICILVLGKTPIANGLDMTSTLIGLYGVSQVFVELDNFRKPQNTDVCRDIGKVFPPFKKIASMWKIILSSLGIGTLIGAIPGTGASIAVFMSRNAASGICSRSKGKLDSRVLVVWKVCLHQR